MYSYYLILGFFQFFQVEFLQENLRNTEIQKTRKSSIICDSLVYFIECKPIIFPSVSKARTINPYSPMEVFAS